MITTLKQTLTRQFKNEKSYYDRMLQICVEVFANSPKEEDERSLGFSQVRISTRSIVTIGAPAAQALRVRLAQEILRRIGASVSELLEDTDRQRGEQWIT